MTSTPLGVCERRKGDHVRPFKGAADGSVEAAEWGEGDDG
jgi:hypothetical protein